MQPVRASFQVSGKVASATRPGVDGLRVVIVDKNIGEDVSVAETTTDADGGYRVVFTYAGSKQKPDLQARAFTGETLLGASEIRYNASSREKLDIPIDRAASTALPSEYETLTAALAKQFDGRLGDLQEGAGRQDITYLANKIGWDARAIAIAALADQFSAATADAGGAAAIAPPFFYALFRAGQPTDQHALYHTKIQAAEAIWQQAIAQGIIPAALEKSLPQAVEQFKRLAVERILDAPARRGISPLDELTALPFDDDPNAQRKFVELYVEHGTDLPGFWKAVESEFPESAGRLRSDSRLGHLTLANAPLVRRLRAGNDLSDPVQLVEAGFYRAEAWQQVLDDEAVPPEIPGKDAKEKAARYAELLAARVRLDFPTAVVAEMVKSGETPLSIAAKNVADRPAVERSRAETELGNLVHTHLAAQAANFDIGAQPVEQYLAQNKLDWPPEVTQEVKRIQRVYQIAPSDTAMNALLRDGVDSAYAVVGQGRDDFIERFKDKVGGETAAASIYDRSQQIHNTVLNIAATYLIARNAPVIGPAGPENLVKYLDTAPRAADQEITTASGVIAYPTLEGLFGEMDFCDCEHCRSILSPAAYLVDLLQFLDRDDATWADFLARWNNEHGAPYPFVDNLAWVDAGQPAPLKPYDALMRRRPDISHLQLTCTNTNTTLPYVDIVNETLEFYVITNSLFQYQGQNTGEDDTPEELLAAPRNNVIDGVNYTKNAYTILALALFPAPMPFSRRLEHLRRYFERLESALPRAMEAMRRNDNLERPVPLPGDLVPLRDDLDPFPDDLLPIPDDSNILATPEYGWRDILMEELRLSRDEYSIFINNLPLWRLYGFPFQTADADVLAALSNAKAFTRRMGVSYDEIDEIRRTAFINLVLANPTAADDVCSFDKLEFRRVDASGQISNPRPIEFVRLHFFIRLWKKLGWTIDQTDKAITALYPANQLPTDPSDAANLQKLANGFLGLLPRLGLLKRLIDALGVERDTDLPALLACFAPIDTHGPTSLYRQMFLSPSFLERYPVFAGSGAGPFPGGSEPLEKYADALRAAFLLTGDELAQIMAALHFDANTRLTLDNMSAIFRRGWLARQLQLSVRELLLLVEATGLDPFAPLDPPDALARPPRGQPPIIRFIDTLSRLRDAGLKPEQALYLVWNQDLSGTSAPQDREIWDFARTLRAGMAAIEGELAVAADVDSQAARAKMALVYGNDTSDFFFGLLDNTFTSEVEYDHGQAALDQAITDVAPGRIAYDGFRKHLSFSGRMSQADRDALKAAAGATDQFKAAVERLYAENQRALVPFFARHSELLPLYQAYSFFGQLKQSVPFTHSQDTLPQSILDIAQGRLGYDNARKQLSFKGVLSGDMRDALRTDAGATDQLRAALDSLQTAANAAIDGLFERYPMLAERRGAYLAANDSPERRRSVLLQSFLPELERQRKRQQTLQAVSAAAKLDPASAAALLDNQVAGRYVLHAASDTAHPALDDFTALGMAGLSAAFFFADSASGSPSITRDAEANLSYSAASNKPPANPASPASAISGIWSGYVEAPEDSSYEFRVETDPDATVTLRLDGKDEPEELVRAGNMWTTASPIELRAGRLHPITLQVEKLKEKLNVLWQTTGRGWQTLPPRSLYSAELNGHLRTAYIRFLKVVSLATGLKLTANEVAHFATLAAYAIGGKAWLSSLGVDGKPDAATSALLFNAFRALLDFAAIKAALAPDDERLLAVLQDPVAATARPDGALYTLTGWQKGSLDALLERFGVAAKDLAGLETFRRVYDGFVLLEKLRIPAPALIAVANNVSEQDDSAFFSALRARYSAADWLTLLKSINDEMRVLQRDALIAYILHRMRSNTSTEHIDTPDKLFEHFLMDVQMDPCMQTSRVRHALSSVQLFIHRSLMNLEPQVAPSVIDAKQWEWMKRYRVWEANRKVFLYPENWLEPELRDDASPIFRETMSELLQGDITDDRAATALVNYLSRLEEIAKLEPCSIYYAPNSIGKPADDVSHVVARTAGANRKYYYRRREGGSWTPWEQIQLDIQDNPVLPMVWNGRLLLFWFRVLKEPQPSPLPGGQNLTGLNTNQIQPNTPVRPKLVLCWSEYYNGKWQATKTSDADHPLNLDETLALPFDPGSSQVISGVAVVSPAPYVFEVKAATEDLGESLRVLAKASLGRGGEFILRNTHSLPDQNDVALSGPWPRVLRTFSKTGANPEVFLDVFMVTYASSQIQPRLVLQSKYEDRWIEPRHAIDELDWLITPFFYLDSRNVFYVTTTLRKAPEIDPIIPDLTELIPLNEPIVPGTNTTLIRASGIAGAVRYDDVWVGPGGALSDGNAQRSNDRIRLIPLPARRLARSQTHEDDISMLSYSEIAGMQFIYTFETFYHPFVGELIKQLNQKSLAGLLDPNFHEQLAGMISVTGRDTLFFHYDYQVPRDPADPNRRLVSAEGSPRQIDVEVGGPYANYNWELFFHIPLTIAVHLSKNQRFAEAQRWFHYIFDPTSNEPTPPPRRFWRFLAFRKSGRAKPVDALLALLSKSDLTEEEIKLKNQVLAGYEALKNNPFQPHLVARTRQVAYQYSVIMKYLDNLIAWGDSLFQQDTVETINEATQLYVLAANILGPRPQRVPLPGKARPLTFEQIKQGAHDTLGNLLIELEGKFSLNPGLPQPGEADTGTTSQLFGMGRALYFCIPPNDKLLGYWDTVADRLFKIRHCMNIEGVVRQLDLFDPPLDPGMLVKAAAAGIDIGSAVNGLQQPVGTVRAPLLIQKALELCGEVRSLGQALLAAVEKGDGERIALLRQSHEVKIQQMQQELRFLQWKQAQEATESLRESRDGPLARYFYYMRLLGETPDSNEAPIVVALDRRELTAANFDEIHAALVRRYTRGVSAIEFPRLKLAAASLGNQAGASGSGNLYLTSSEDLELNHHLPAARDMRKDASDLNTIASILTYIPDFAAKASPLGIGVESLIFGGVKLADALKIRAQIISTDATWEQDQAGIASRTAAYERRADEWILQVRLAAQELELIGQQLIGSLIAEQVARREYLNVTKQIEQAQELDRFLHEKFSNEQLYAWMQGEISRLYYEYYRFAFDTARKAEQTMKRELMRPEVDATDYIKFNYWDGGRKGLLAGEALYLDVKRMELAYYDNNRRELELARHVSLRLLDPVALLTLKATGACQVTIPEWLYDMDCPGHYMRRIKSVALSIPCVVGPYTSVNCTLSLLKSSVRTSAVAGENYARRGPEDDRFVDYTGAIQSIVTSSAQNDSGLFEVNLRDERFLPFEGAGAVSTWTLSLPKDYRAFDYATISDVVLHIRYTARQGVDPTKVRKALDDLFHQADQANLALLFSLRYDFSAEWAAFLGGAADFKAAIRRDHFPYFTQGKKITISGFELYTPDGANPPKHQLLGDKPTWDAATTALNDSSKQVFIVAAGQAALGPPQALSGAAGAQVFLIIRYSL